MRAIIIDDKDARALLERLELAKFRNNRRLLSMKPEIFADEGSLDEMHRWFHYVVCSWLQEQGAHVIR